MSTHKECGADIHWFRRGDDPERFLPPHEFVGVFKVEISGEMVERPCYRTHNCDPEMVVAWQERLRKIAEATGRTDEIDGMLAHQAARERDREERWKLALVVECPRCMQGVGDKCASMARQHIKSGELIELMNPHPERTAEAESLSRWKREDFADD